MKKILLLVLFVAIGISNSFAGLATNMLWNVQGTATTGNVNGGGFNPNSAFFPTDGIINSGTGATPTFSSVSYTFQNIDTNACLYLKSGTGVNPTLYRISSVSGGIATIDASNGAGTQYSSNAMAWVTTTNVGAATSAVLSNITWGVDYSCADTASVTSTDLASPAGSSMITSATGTWGTNHLGNIIHVTGTGTGAHFLTNWFEIVTVSNATTIVVDRTPNDGTAGVAGTGQTGGAARPDLMEDLWFESLPTGSIIYWKGGTTTTLSGNVSVSAAPNSEIFPGFLIGYKTVRGDVCNGTDRPVIAAGANTCNFTTFFCLKNMSFTSTAAAGIAPSSSAYSLNCKFLNTSSTAGRYAITATAANSGVIDSDVASLNGHGINATSGTFSRFFGNYIHDCGQSGVTGVNQGTTYEHNIFARNVGDCINNARQVSYISCNFNTFYGRQDKIGIGANYVTPTQSSIKSMGNIFYGLATGNFVANASPTNSQINLCYANVYFNNTTNTSSFCIGPTALLVDPQFANARELTGTTATTSGSVLTDSSADYNAGGVIDNVTILRVISGTGVTPGGYLVTGHTATTLTVNNALGTSSGGDVVYFLGVGSNFTPMNPIVKIGGAPKTSTTGSGSMINNAAGGSPPNTDPFANSLLSP